MSSTSKLYPPADISKQTVLVTGAEHQIPCTPGWNPQYHLIIQTHVQEPAQALARRVHGALQKQVYACRHSRARIGGNSFPIKMQLMAHLCRLQTGADSPENRQAGEAGQGVA